MIAGMRKSRLSIEQWRGILQKQQASGLTVAAFCRQARVPQASFFAWRRKLRDAMSFAEVKVTPEPARETAAIPSSFTSTGRRHGVNPRVYLAQLLANLPDTPVSHLDQWLPGQ